MRMKRMRMNTLTTTMMTMTITCEKNGEVYAIDAGSIEWVEPLPEGFERVEAYLAWARSL
jgi:hypothetical protein